MSTKKNKKREKGLLNESQIRHFLRLSNLPQATTLKKLKEQYELEEEEMMDDELEDEMPPAEEEMPPAEEEMPPAEDEMAMGDEEEMAPVVDEEVVAELATAIASAIEEVTGVPVDVEDAGMAEEPPMEEPVAEEPPMDEAPPPVDEPEEEEEPLDEGCKDQPMEEALKPVEEEQVEESKEFGGTTDHKMKDGKLPTQLSEAQKKEITKRVLSRMLKEIAARKK